MATLKQAQAEAMGLPPLSYETIGDASGLSGIVGFLSKFAPSYTQSATSLMSASAPVNTTQFKANQANSVNSIDYKSLINTYLAGLGEMDAEARNYDTVVRNENYAYNSAEAQKQREFESLEARLNREFQQTSADKAMAFTANENQINREFQERMSNTAYQRAVEDMRAAGLSPLLAYSQGGASSPAGSSGSGVSASGSAAKGSQASSGYSLSSRQYQQTVTSVISSLLDYLIRSESNDIKKTEVATKSVTSLLGSLIPVRVFRK